MGIRFFFFFSLIRLLMCFVIMNQSSVIWFRNDFNRLFGNFSIIFQEIELTKRSKNSNHPAGTVQLCNHQTKRKRKKNKEVKDIFRAIDFPSPVVVILPPSTISCAIDASGKKKRKNSWQFPSSFSICFGIAALQASYLWFKLDITKIHISKVVLGEGMI